MNHTLSALIFNYNGARFLTEAIESVLKQEQPPVDIVVADDGSTDDSKSRAAAFGGRVTWLDLPHGGQAAAMNAAVSACAGSWIAFLESDDVWLPGKLAAVAAEIEKDSSLAAVQHEMEQVDATLKPLPTARTTAFQRWRLDDYLAGRTLLTGMSALTARRDVVEKILPLPGDLTTCIDDFLQPRLLALGEEAHLASCLGLRRVHGDNFYAGIKSDPRRLQAHIELVGRLDRHLAAFLAARGARLSDQKIKKDAFERLQLSLFLHRGKGQLYLALRDWLAVLSSASLFKSATLLLALLSPLLYLRLQEAYERILLRRPS